MLFLSATPVHVVLFRRVRIRRYHVKAGLAYGGAFLMGLDAGVAILGPFLFPHIAHACEASVGTAGKVGAAASGFSAFFDRIIATAVKEAAESSQ